MKSKLGFGFVVSNRLREEMSSHLVAAAERLPLFPAVSVQQLDVSLVEESTDISLRKLRGRTLRHPQDRIHKLSRFQRSAILRNILWIPGAEIVSSES